MSSAISCQITAIGELLRNRGKLVVPPYQRNYAWEEENYSDLWFDILETFNGTTDEYFLGSVVLDNSTSPDLTLIDGQQRVTTTTILICALKWHLLSNELDDLATLVTHDFLSHPDYDHTSLTPNLVLNLNNSEFFERHILTTNDPKHLETLINDENYSPSNLQLASCYIYMAKQIAKLAKERGSLKDVAQDIIAALREKVQIIRIDVANDLQAFTLFEALHNRGVELSEADLIKNHIFSTAKQDIDELKTNWELMCQNLGYDYLIEYLKHYWNSTIGPLPSQGLLAGIKKRIDTAEKARNFSRQITESSEFYGAILDPNHDLWQRISLENKDEIKTNLFHLSLIRTEQHNILLMAILEHAPECFYDYLIMIKNFTFRYSTIGGKNTTQLQRTYMKAAQTIRQETPITAEACFLRFLSELYPPDSQFHSSFAKKIINNTALARHILCEINNNLSQGQDRKRYSAASQDIDLEHILPKKYQAHWQKEADHFPGGPHKYLNRIGNMTLISPEDNTTDLLLIV